MMNLGLVHMHRHVCVTSPKQPPPPLHDRTGRACSRMDDMNLAAQKDACGHAGGRALPCRASQTPHAGNHQSSRCRYHPTACAVAQACAWPCMTCRPAQACSAARRLSVISRRTPAQREFPGSTAAVWIIPTTFPGGACMYTCGQESYGCAPGPTETIWHTGSA